MTKSYLLASSVALALAMASTLHASAGSFTSRAPWEAAQSAFADVDESQWGVNGSPFPAGTPIHLPFGGIDLNFDKSLEGYQVPIDWDSWSGGNTPRVLYVPDRIVTGTFTSAVSDFGLEMEPDAFGPVIMTLQLDDGTVISQLVTGLGGAGFFGWSGVPVVSFSLDGSEEFAFGRMVQGSVTAIPDAGATLGLLGLAVGSIIAAGRRPTR